LDKEGHPTIAFVAGCYSVEIVRALRITRHGEYSQGDRPNHPTARNIEFAKEVLAYSLGRKKILRISTDTPRKDALEAGGKRVGD
jgi:hypothetical protein